MSGAGITAPVLSRAFRDDGGRVLAALIAQFRDCDFAEEALAEAFLRAAQEWQSAPPDVPGAWLLTVARRVALAPLRKAARHARPGMTQAVAEALWPEPDPVDPDAASPTAIPDELLRLVFTCCHPALGREAQVALTLRSLGSLGVDEIARAFLIKPGALERRLTRAKDKIRRAQIPYRVPNPPELPQRLPQVLEVIYRSTPKAMPPRRARRLPVATSPRKRCVWRGWYLRCCPCRKPRACWRCSCATMPAVLPGWARLAI